MWIDLIIVRRRTGLRSPSITGGPGMVEVTVRDGIAVFAVEGVDKLWALKSHLEIPLAHIRDIRLDAEAARGWWHGIKAPGTHVPGVITAGTFYQHGKRIFWDVHNPERVIVIALRARVPAGRRGYEQGESPGGS